MPLNSYYPPSKPVYYAAPSSPKILNFILESSSIFIVISSSFAVISFLTVSAKYSCGFPDPQALPIIVVDRYLDYFTTIMEDRLWQVLAKPVFRWRNRFGLSMNAARAAWQMLTGAVKTALQRSSWGSASETRRHSHWPCTAFFSGTTWVIKDAGNVL